MSTLESLKAVSQTLASTHPDLKLLILFGSRARGEEDSTSDWDFAFSLDPEQPVDRRSLWFSGSDLLNTLSNLLHVSEDKIDLVNLENCSDILAHFVARDGQVIYEKTPGEFAQFRQRALKSEAELKEFRRSQREKVFQALQRWEV